MGWRTSKFGLVARSSQTRRVRQTPRVCLRELSCWLGLSALTTLLVAVTGSAQSPEESAPVVITHLEGDPKHDRGDLTLGVTVVPAGQEAQVLQEIFEKHPESSVAVFHTGASDSAKDAVAEVLAGNQRADVVMVEVDREKIDQQISEVVHASESLAGQPAVAAEVAGPYESLEGQIEVPQSLGGSQQVSGPSQQALGVGKKTVAERIQNSWRALREHRRHITSGLLVSMQASLIFAGTTWLITKDAAMAGGVLPVIFAASAYQTVGVSSWRNFLRRGGDVSTALLSRFVSWFGGELKRTRSAAAMGRIGAAIAFNVPVGVIIGAITGSIHQGLLTAIALGMLGSWDAGLDLAVDRFVERGKLKPEVFDQVIKVRLRVAPVVESAAYSGMAIAGPAAVVMGIVGGGSLLALFAGEHLEEAYHKVSQRLAVAKEERRLKQLRAEARHNCAALLSGRQRADMVPDDIQ